MKTLILLLVLVSCGKDPGKGPVTAPVAKTSTESNFLSCYEVAGCKSICEDRKNSCESICWNGEFRNRPNLVNRCLTDCRDAEYICKSNQCNQICNDPVTQIQCLDVCMN